MRKFVLKGLTLLSIGAVPIWAASFWLSDLFTRGYVYFQIFVFLLVLGILSEKRGWHTHTNTAASILTIVGVLGTFIGIFVGLQEFTTDPAIMQESISELLDGLKLAFLTSIVGIVSALLLKGIISPIAQILQKGNGQDEDAVDSFVGKLKTALEPLLTSGESNLSSQFDGLITALKEDNKTTRNVLRGMRTDLTEGQIKSLTQLETLTNSCEKQSELLNGVIPLLTTIQDSLTNEEIGVIAKLEVLTTTVSEKQDALLNGVKDALTPIQTSLADEQASVLTKLEVLTTTVSEKQDALLNGVKDALTPIQTSLADEQAGVLAKLETLTATVSDEHDKLRTEFETFSNNVAESITKLATNELISALSDVIEKFNAKITEQFGDNFKQLNEAVGKTVEWQQQYREQMNELASEFRMAADSIEQSRGSLENIAESSSAIAERSGSIVACAENMEPILQTMNGQLETFSTLRQKAEDSLPIINKNIDELTTKFSSAVEKAIIASDASMQRQRKAFSEQSVQLDAALRQSAQNINTQVDILRDGLEEALTKSLNGLVNQLTSLSHQFVKDYTPLTIELQRLVETARIVEGERNRGNVR